MASELVGAPLYYARDQAENLIILLHKKRMRPASCTFSSNQ
jgi:hypothetical protein